MLENVLELCIVLSTLKLTSFVTYFEAIYVVDLYVICRHGDYSKGSV